MTSPTRRVEQLLALATDPAASEEEARSAAIAAARSIRANNFQVVSQGHQEPVYSSAPSSYSPYAHSYDATVVPRGRQLGTGTPGLPPPRRAPARRELAETSYDPDRKGGPRVVDWDFKDPVPEQKKDYAFDPSLLALLKK